MQAQILAPAAVLVVWTLIMLSWLALTRLPPLFKQPGGLAAAKKGGRGQDLEGGWSAGAPAGWSHCRTVC